MRDMGLKINIGCGHTPTEGWRNFDNTLAIRLARSPVSYSIARLLRLLDKAQMENVEWNRKNSLEFADATKHIPLPNASVSCIYTSHMFEHLSQEGGKRFLGEALRVLEADGVLRISVPDLRKAVASYLKSNNADTFIASLHIAAPPVNTTRQKLRLFVSGYRHHQWMYDGDSLANLMRGAGFRNVTIQAAGNTLIKSPGALNLSERVEESVYVEGVK